MMREIIPLQSIKCVLTARLPSRAAAKEPVRRFLRILSAKRDVIVPSAGTINCTFFYTRFYHEIQEDFSAEKFIMQER